MEEEEEDVVSGTSEPPSVLQIPALKEATTYSLEGAPGAPHRNGHNTLLSSPLSLFPLETGRRKRM